MTLARMISTSEDDLVCDFAEIYGVLDMRSLPLRKAAALACGLNDDSRIKRRLSGCKLTFEQLMLTMIYDKLNWLCWTKTKAAQRGNGCPEPLTKKLLGDQGVELAESFDTAEDFEKRRKEIAKG